MGDWELYTIKYKKYSDPRTTPKVKAALKPKLDVIKQMFPQKLSEAEPNKS